MNQYILGIDLGTYNSSAFVLGPGGEPRLVSSGLTGSIEFGRQKPFPSFVSFHPDGSVKEVGLPAKEQAIYDPSHVVWGVKRLLGKTYEEAKEHGELDRFSYEIEADIETGGCLIKVGQKSFRPENICAEIIKRIKDKAEKEVGVSIDNVVISVPAYFDAISVKPIREAAKAAGFSSIKNIPEPVAAALAYQVAFSRRILKVIVFDLGAGTLDVTAGNLVRKGPKPTDMTFQVKANTGNTHLGGVDMDDRILRLLKEKSGLTSVPAAEMIRVRSEAEKTKIRLSNDSKTEVAFGVAGRSYSFSINRSEIERALSGQRTEIDVIDACRIQVIEALKEAGWETAEVDQILLIGGPSCMPCIRLMLKEVFRRNPRIRAQLEQLETEEIGVDPMEAVAKGAALSLGTKTINKHPYGYGFIDLEFQPDKILHNPQILIPRGSTYPCQGEPHWIEWFSQAPKTEIEIIQHVPEKEPPPAYRYLGPLGITLKNPSLSPIEVKMGLNENEELMIELRELFSGHEVKYTGVGHLRRIPCVLPRTTPKPPDISKIERLTNEETVKDLVKWAEFIHKLCRARLEEANTEVTAEIRPLLTNLGETLNIFAKKAKDHVPEISDDANALRHRAANLGLLRQEEDERIKKEEAEVMSRLYTYKNAL